MSYLEHSVPSATLSHLEFPLSHSANFTFPAHARKEDFCAEVLVDLKAEVRFPTADVGSLDRWVDVG